MRLCEWGTRSRNYSTLLIMHVALLVGILQRLCVMWLDTIIVGSKSDEHVCIYRRIGSMRTRAPTCALLLFSCREMARGDGRATQNTSIECMEKS